MPTANIADFAVTGEWQNLLVAYPAIAGKDCILQNKINGSSLYVVAEGAQPSSSTQGARPCYLEQFYFSCSTALWVRTESKGGTIAVWTV